MELEITGKKENKTLQRQEVELEIKDVKLTPSRKELRPKIAALLGAKEELTVIEKIEHSFGTREGKIKAYIYENKEAMKKIEPIHLTERDLGKKKKKEEKPAEKKPEGKEEKKHEGKPSETVEKPAEKKEKGKKEGKEEKPTEEKKEGGN